MLALDRVITALADFRVESHEPVPAIAPAVAAAPVCVLLFIYFLKFGLLISIQQPIADRVAASLEAGAERLSQGIENTTALLAAGIEASQGFLQARIQPLEEPMSVNPFISMALRGAASGSGYVVAVRVIRREKRIRCLHPVC